MSYGEEVFAAVGRLRDGAVDALVAFLRGTGAREVGVRLPPILERVVTLQACRSAGLEVVDLAARPPVVVTADGVLDAGCVHPLKDEVDELVPDARTVIVVRHLGPVPLAPTLDAYLDTWMIPGRDVWFHDVCPDYVGASGRSFGSRAEGSSS